MHMPPIRRCLQVNLQLPSARAMQTVVDRMRATSQSLKHLTLHADGGAREISLAVATEELAIRTYFRGLAPAALGGASQSQLHGGCMQARHASAVIMQA